MIAFLEYEIHRVFVVVEKYTEQNSCQKHENFMAGFSLMLWTALKYIIEFIFSNHLKWCAQPILSDLFLPTLLTQPTHFSASHFQGFTFSTFQLFKFQNVSISLAEC